MTENRRRALAESYFEVGRTAKADELFQSWLTAGPRWGWGWIGWADCYSCGYCRPGTPASPPAPETAGDHGRAEELLRRGYTTPDVRDRGYIAERLRDLCERTGRAGDARDFGQQARRLLRERPTATVSRRLELADPDDGPAAVRETTTLDFGAEGLPLHQFPDVIRAVRARPPGTATRSVKVGRTAPCPCGSGKKFKKCCGSPAGRG